MPALLAVIPAITAVASAAGGVASAVSGASKGGGGGGQSSAPSAPSAPVGPTPTGMGAISGGSPSAIPSGPSGGGGPSISDLLAQHSQANPSGVANLEPGQNPAMMARGGIVDRPTHAIVGEAGAEARVPVGSPTGDPHLAKLMKLRSDIDGLLKGSC